MTSLREEIFESLNKLYSIGRNDYGVNECYIDIISIFEKKIDGLIKQEDERAEDMIYDIDSYSSSYAVMVLKKVKEMLKE